MKAMTKNAISFTLDGKTHVFDKGAILDVTLADNQCHRGRIEHQGEWICDLNSTFSDSQFYLLDDDEVHLFTAGDSALGNAERLAKIKQKHLRDITPADLDWLIQKATENQIERDA